MHFGILQFPGSNCDQDIYGVAARLPGVRVSYIWHKDGQIPDADAYVVPGGFSYGDYLRCGAIARFSPAMKEVVARARGGVPIIGICNGFQILCESGLLPGALVRNQNLHFICRWVSLRVENTRTAFTSSLHNERVLRMPIAHGEGCYFADPETLNRLEGEGRVVFRYCDASGQITDEANPNGSLRNIAGICNEVGNVVGLMPHPERACDALLGSTDGWGIFESVLATLAHR